MAAYVVMEPPGRPSEEARDRASFIRDGFSLLAFLVPPLWLLWHRLWIEAALVFAASLGLGTLGEALGLGAAGAALSFLVSLYVGLEGAALRIAALTRRGWSDRGVVEADNREEAEIRYLTALDDGSDGEAVPPASATPMRMTPPSASGPALGLFSYPGRG